jgi:hypothetical protein
MALDDALLAGARQRKCDSPQLRWCARRFSSRGRHQKRRASTTRRAWRSAGGGGPRRPTAGAHPALARVYVQRHRPTRGARAGGGAAGAAYGTHHAVLLRRCGRVGCRGAREAVPAGERRCPTARPASRCRPLASSCSMGPDGDAQLVAARSGARDVRCCSTGRSCWPTISRRSPRSRGAHSCRRPRRSRPPSAAAHPRGGRRRRFSMQPRGRARPHARRSTERARSWRCGARRETPAAHYLDPAGRGAGSRAATYGRRRALS